MEYIINMSWDNDAGVWCAVCDEIPLALESNSFDALIERVKITAQEMLVLNNKSPLAELCFITNHWAKIA